MEWTIRLETKTGWGEMETVELVTITRPVCDCYGGRRRAFSRRGEIADCQITGCHGSRTGGRVSTVPSYVPKLPHLPAGKGSAPGLSNDMATILSSEGKL
jgi:hypothetical protein